MKSSHRIMLLLMTSALIALVVGAKTDKNEEYLNLFKKYWPKRSLACKFGKHQLSYSRCMEILNRFKDMTTLSEVKSELTKYRDCDDLNKGLPNATQQLLVLCLKGMAAS